ncbi:MAG: hypothetical protein H7338_18495 [Candidatus Sericytochromatia bacterium]|nr:hypothetical protein [Candidatus Sericytochromatia bacterium]
MTLTILHSPDADDRFMFWALKTGRLPSPVPMTFGEADTQQLNERAMRHEADVIAIWAATYPAVAAWYQPLRMGCSLGDGYGPVIVAKSPCTLADLAGRRIAVPGLQTTAYQVLRTMLPYFEPVVVPIVPMSRTFEVLHAGEVDAALLIHEGRLIYERFNTVKIGELGELWQAANHTPLPLGMNVVARRLPMEQRQALSDLFVESFDAGMAELETFVTEYTATTPMDAAELRQYLSMYANASTRTVKDSDKAGFKALYGCLAAAGVLSAVPELDWI